MSNSKENDNGRYFEYLIVRKLQKDFHVFLTERAIKDQERDSTKSVDSKTFNEMNSAAAKIIGWLNQNLLLNNNTCLDRFPDKEVGETTHEDISITDGNNKKISFSLKHNHEAIFHGRILSVASWLGIKRDNDVYKNFQIKKGELIKSLHTEIPVGTVFASGGIRQEYEKPWSEFVFGVHEEAIQTLIYANSNQKYVENLFNKIIGQGSNQFRVLLKNKKIFIQDLSNIIYPTRVEISNIKKPLKKGKGESAAWYLVLNFDNGIEVFGRSKQDSGTMAKTPKLKHDWKVEDWGKSGMCEQEI